MCVNANHLGGHLLHFWGLFFKEYIGEIHIMLFGFVVCRIAWVGEGGSDAVLYGQGGYWYFIDPQ